MQHLRQFGEELGISFQLRDDYLDAFGDPEKFGKQVGGDILADKKTYLLIRCYEKASSEDLAMLRSLAGKRANAEEKVETIRGIMTALEADSEILETSERYYQSALTHLDALKLPATSTAPLRELAAQLLERQS